MVNCPWGWLDPSKMSFCEERLCAWIVEPSNAWSNLGFIFIGAYLLWRPATHKATFNHFGIIAILVGIFSFAFHATGTELFHAFDTGAMMLLSNSLLLFNLKRLGSIKKTALFFAILSTVTFLVTLLVNEMLGLYLFGAGVTLAILLELRLYKTQTATIYKPLIIGLGIFALAFTIWLLDKQGVVCSPTNHILTGHAVWHFLNALTFWALANFYAQFEVAPN